MKNLYLPYKMQQEGYNIKPLFKNKNKGTINLNGFHTMTKNVQNGWRLKKTPRTVREKTPN